MSSRATHYKDRFYDSYYQTHVLPRKGPASPQQFEKAVKVFNFHFGVFLPKEKSARILDAGCGNGKAVFWLQKLGYEQAEGIDSSGEQIQAGREAGVAHLEVAEITPFLRDRPGSFDLILLRDVLEHVDKRQVLDLLELCQSALQPGGRIVIQVPNGASPFCGRILYGDFTHETAFTETSLSQLFRLAGYEDLVFRPFEPFAPRITSRLLLRRAGWRTVGRRLAWWGARKFYSFLLFAELGPHRTITTYNIIASGLRPHPAAGRT